MEKPYHGIERRLEEVVRNEKQRNVVLAIITHCVTWPRHVIVPVVASCTNY